MLGFSKLKSIMISKLILGKSENFSLFNSTRVDFGHFFVNYISKSYFNQYFPNINQFISKSIITKLIIIKSILSRINSIKAELNTNNWAHSIFQKKNSGFYFILFLYF